MTLSIGIDLGTTNSVAAVATPRGVEFTLDVLGSRIHPSVVAFPSAGGVLVGQAAREHRTIEPRRTVYSAKRLIGQNVRSPMVQLALTALPYQVDEGPNQQPLIAIGERSLPVPQISAEVLAYLRSATERQLGDEVRQAVITVPANFSDAQRQATKEAGRLAGLEVLRLINEPTAAALAYGYGQNMDAVVAVFDFGGGTFDISLLRVRGQIFEVIATDGELFLGGDDIDRTLAEYLASEMNRTMRIDPRPYPETLTRLVLAAEEIKRHLSLEDRVEGTIDYLIVGDRMLSLPFALDRQQFESMIEGYVDQTMEVCRRAVVSSGLSYRDIDVVICVGGSTRIPVVRARLTELFGRLPAIRINPDEVVAHGAAIQAGSLSGKLGTATGMATEEVATPRQRLLLPLPPSDATDSLELPRMGTTVTPGPHMVAGDAAQEPPRPLLLDVTPATLGVATAGGYTDRILDKNAPIPIERSKLFTTAHHNQERVVIDCCRGEAARFGENERLGTLVLDGLPPAPRAQVIIEVTFRVDADGILHVRARDGQTGQEQHATLNVLGAPVEGDPGAANLPSRSNT